MAIEVHRREETSKGRLMKFTWSATVAATCALLAASMSVRSCSTRSEVPSSTRATKAQVAVGALGSPSDLTGIRTVIWHHIPGISAMNDDDTKSWHGRTVRLSAEADAAFCAILLCSVTQTTFMPRSRSRTANGTKSRSPEPITSNFGRGVIHANSIASTASDISVMLLSSGKLTNGRTNQACKVSANPFKFSALP